MNTHEWRHILKTIIAKPNLHCRWLATLSHLENCGARKIMNYQPYLGTDIELLQHAAEESRHAYYFSKQINKINPDSDNKWPLLAGHMGKRFLHRLDLGIARLLQNTKIPEKTCLNNSSYLLTTYGIELRAEILYDLYEAELQKSKSPVSILSIIREEKHHLAQMEESINKIPGLAFVKPQVLALEESLFKDFEILLKKSIGEHLAKSA